MKIPVAPAFKYFTIPSHFPPALGTPPHRVLPPPPAPAVRHRSKKPAGFPETLAFLQSAAGLPDLQCAPSFRIRRSDIACGASFSWCVCPMAHIMNFNFQMLLPHFHRIFHKPQRNPPFSRVKSVVCSISVLLQFLVRSIIL